MEKIKRLKYDWEYSCWRYKCPRAECTYWPALRKNGSGCFACLARSFDPIITEIAKNYHK